MPTRKPILLTKAIDEFIHYLKSKERSKETERGYNIVLQNFKNYLEKEMNGQAYVDEITVNHIVVRQIKSTTIRHFILTRIAEKRSNKAYYKHLIRQIK